jgi:predicted permease
MAFDFAGDIRFAFRMIAKAPSFTAVAVTCLAIGIGMNSTLFSLVDGYWTRPLPIADPGGIVHLYTATVRNPQDGISFPEYQEYSRARCFRGLAVTERRGGILTGPGYTDLLQSNVVSGNYFQVLGISPHAGRFFAPGETAGARVVVLSYNLWQRRFNSDPGIVGRTVQIGGMYTVVGIAPRGFRGTEAWRDSDVWIPLESWDPSGREAAERGYRSYTAIGRLAPGTSLQPARAELLAISTRLESDWPKFNRGCRSSLLSERERLFSNKIPYLIMGVVAMVLLIACVNVAGLLVARAGARTHEVAIRAALGASRGRLIGHFLTESALLAAMGAAAGLALARVLISVLPAIIIPPAYAPFFKFDFRLDHRVLIFTIVISMVAVIGFGLMPALRASRPLARNARRPWMQRGMVSAQLAVSVMLLGAAGLMVRTFIHCMAIDPGFTRAEILVADIAPPFGPTGSIAFYDSLFERVRKLPGVVEATVALRAPLGPSGGGRAQHLMVPGSAATPNGVPARVRFTAVAPGYFRTLAIPLTRGRDFSSHDLPDSARVMVVNRTMAERFWPGEDPVGKIVRLGDGGANAGCTVVGVSGDARINSIVENPEAYFYLPMTQIRTGESTLLVRTAGPALDLARPLRQTIRQVNSNVLVLSVTSLGQLVRSSLFVQQVSAMLMGAMGLIGLVLAATGLYGAVSYTVAERTREIGIRMALGAQPADALRLVLRLALTLTGAGIALGLLGAWIAARLLGELLVGVKPHDPVTMFTVTALLFAVALVASYLPARRAARVDPSIALRWD